MTEQTPEQIAEKISDDLVERYGMDLGRLTRAIAAALTTERERARPPAGHVRLPDGRDVKVLGTLPMTADGCVVGFPPSFGGLWFINQYGHRVQTNPMRMIYDQSSRCVMVFGDGLQDRPVGTCYSTRAAAESARGGGGEETPCTR